MASIKLQFKEKVLGNYQIGVGDTLLIGRDNVNDIVIDNLAVSAQHAKIESIGKGFLFVDLDSENGSYVNKHHSKSHWLNHSDLITIGKHTLEFSNQTSAQEQKIKTSMITRTMQLDSKKIRELLKSNELENNKNTEPKRARATKNKKPIAMLSYLSGNKKDVQLIDDLIKIGKDSKSDVFVKGIGVGKTAAVINKTADGWYISYVRGFSKPRVNSAPLMKAIKLNNLDIITVGSTQLQFKLGHPN